MIITDNSQNPAVNKSVNLKDLANFSDGRTDCTQVLATGTISAGSVKLTVSQDNANFYPLTDEYGAQIVLTPAVPVYLKFANLYIKCDLTGVTSADLKVTVQ
jgi:hypothetical protein